MELILFMIYWLLVNIGLLRFIKWTENNIGVYDTMFCRDVRAQLGMITYASDLEETRKRLNHPKSKF